ncbi:DNA recombination protein RmuC [Candidatus Saccharibacteria bacterium]|nr:DNA recombination protein RmuC [Candidatus Saccharibacteria bacterium]
METLLIIVLVLLVAGFGAVIYLLNKKISGQTNDQATSLLKTDLDNLNRGVGELKESLQENINQKLALNQAQMTENIQKQFSQSAKIIADVTQRLTKLDETNRRVVDVADELKTLQNVLQNPKQRGVVGEYYLQSVLENVMPPGKFQMQYKFEDGETVDAVIFLQDKKILPIDSKFSLENYNRLIEESDQKTKNEIVKKFKTDLKNRIDETSKYIRPNEDTMDFAFMFIPSESLYYDLLINKVGTTATNSRDLIEYAFQEKKVIIVSPTSFMAYLQTVLQGLRSLQIEEQAKDIQKRVGELGRHIGGYETFMQKLGNSLGTTVNHYNNAHKELKKIDKDVVKIAGVTPGVDPLMLDKPSQDE